MPSDGQSWDERIANFFSAITRGVLGIKLGPGVLATIIPINTVGLVALAALVFALSNSPILALIGFLFGLAFLVYANERAFRYAQANPIPALLGGGELLQLIRDQAGARDRSVIVEGPPVTAASVDTIERKDGGNV